VNNFNLTKLIKEYFELPKGYLIDNPNTLNFICKIFYVCDVYISNKALKHIVESRRDKDFMNVDEIVNIVKGFTIVLLDPDVVFINQNRLNSIGVCKDIKFDTSLSTLIILEYINDLNHYEIITTYERKKKQIQKMINIKHLIK
jgi:hypothetical protein